MAAPTSPTALPRLDELLSFKAMYDRYEALMTGPIQNILGSDGFVQLMGATREQILTQQQNTRDGLETYWEQLRLPSLADHARLAGQVVALESKVEAVEDQLEGINAKLDAILAQLERQATRSHEKAKA